MGHNAAAKDTTKSPNNQFFAVPVLQQKKKCWREDLTFSLREPKNDGLEEALPTSRIRGFGVFSC